MEMDFSFCAHSINNIHTDHICAICRKILFIQHHPQFCYLLIIPLLLCRSSLLVCLTVRCSSSWNVLHERTAGNFYWALDWHSRGQGHYCACGNVVWSTSRGYHGYLRWPVLSAWEHMDLYTLQQSDTAVADVGAFHPYYKDGAGYRHFTSVRPHTLTQTFVLSGRICLPYCVPLRVSNVMVTTISIAHYPWS
jgi:hypothetical protein